MISDREDLSSRNIIEQAEIDIALALKSQLLIKHGVPILFARLLDLIIHLRAMTTEYLEAILNSPLQGSDQSATKGSSVSAETLQTVSGSISASVESISDLVTSSSAILSSEQSPSEELHALSEGQQILSPATKGNGSEISSGITSVTHSGTSSSVLKHNPIPVSSLIMSPRTPSSSPSVVMSRNLGSTHETRMFAPPQVTSSIEGNMPFTTMTVSLDSSSQRLSSALQTRESFQSPMLQPVLSNNILSRPLRTTQNRVVDPSNYSNATNLPRTIPAKIDSPSIYVQSVPTAVPFRARESTSRTNFSQEAHEIASRTAAHQLQLLQGSLRPNTGVSPTGHQTRPTYVPAQLPLTGIGPSTVAAPKPQVQPTEDSNSLTIPRQRSIKPLSFVSLLRGDNDSTSEILRSDYQLVRGEGLGSGVIPQTQSIFTKPEREASGSNKFNVIRSDILGNRKSAEETVSDLESPSKIQKTEPDLIPKTAVPGDPSLYLDKTPIRDNGTIDAAVRWAAILEANKPKQTSGNTKPWIGSILETQLRKGIENVNMSQISSSTPSLETDASPWNHGVQRANSLSNQRMNSGVITVVSSTSSQSQSDISDVSNVENKPKEQISRYSILESQLKLPQAGTSISTKPKVPVKKQEMRDENLRKLLSSNFTTLNRTGNGDTSNSDTESETETKEMGLK